MKSSVVIFWALETSAVSWTSAASATSLASTASTALFPHKTSWFWWFDHQWYQNDQYRSFFVEWIIKNQNISLIDGTLSVGGCWGQPLLIFWKLVDETQISQPKEYTDAFKQNLTCLFLSVRAILKETFQCDCETPCTTGSTIRFWHKVKTWPDQMFWQIYQKLMLSGFLSSGNLCLIHHLKLFWPHVASTASVRKSAIY